LSLLLGAFLGALAYDAFALYALIAPAAVSGVLALITAFLVLRAGQRTTKVESP
jgi:predicted MFS family arabinose efflux permease